MIDKTEKQGKLPNCLSLVSQKQENLQPAKKFLITWCARRRHKDISLFKGHRVIRDGFSVSGNEFTAICALARQPLSNTEPSKWAIHFGKVDGYSFAGICLQENAIQHGFRMWSWRKTGHGNYVLCSSSMAYSHSDSKSNYIRYGFTFDCGDILDFEFDPIRERFTCQKRRSDRKYVFEIGKPEGRFYPCIYLVDKTNWVESVEPI